MIKLNPILLDKIKALGLDIQKILLFLFAVNYSSIYDPSTTMDILSLSEDESKFILRHFIRKDYRTKKVMLKLPLYDTSKIAEVYMSGVEESKLLAKVDNVIKEQNLKPVAEKGLRDVLNDLRAKGYTSKGHPNNLKTFTVLNYSKGSDKTFKSLLDSGLEYNILLLTIDKYYKETEYTYPIKRYLEEAIVMDYGTLKSSDDWKSELI
jgi:hypothetical protein